MSFASGTFSINSSGQPVVTGTVISSTDFNNFTADIATGLSTCVLKDGTQTITANIPMSTFKITGLGAATARTDAASLANIQDGTGVYVGTVGGTADVITLTPSPAITSYTSGQAFYWIASGANTTNVTVNVSGLGAKALTKNGSTALVANDILSGALIGATYDGTRFQLTNVGNSVAATIYDAKGDLISATAADTPARLAVGSNGLFLESLSTESTGIRWGNPSKVCEGRLTLTTATAVTTSDVTAATAVYFTPYKGDKIALYDGTNWRVYTFTEINIAVPATTATMYDIFIYDNSGTLTLDATAWTNDTTRATALALQNGVYVKTGSTSRRYLGSFRTTAVSGKTEDSKSNRFLWNYYNRSLRVMQATDSTDTWAYTTAAFRQANNSTANQLNFIIGVSEDEVNADVRSSARNISGNVIWTVAVGLDSTTAKDSNSIGNPGESAAANVLVPTSATWRGYPGIGYHYLAWIEFSAATGTTTWIGNGGTTYLQSGINGYLYG